MIYFVGAGPGAEDLITVRGMRYLEKADTVIYAGSLVNPALLSHTRPGCRIYDSSIMSLPEVLQVMEEAEAGGGDTVRLHTGDPSLYGAIREQMDGLAEKGIAFEVCPGVSSFSAAAASLNLEYTLPGVSQSLIITRAAGRCSVPEGEDIAALASHGASMVFFLSAGLAEEVRRGLLRGGVPEDTPAAVVYKASWEEERICRTTVGGLSEAVERFGVTKTALLVVGRALEAAGERSRLYDPAFATGCRRIKEAGNTGIFYCVGTGPGGAAMLTEEALAAVRGCPVLAVPAGSRTESPAGRTVMAADAGAAYKEWLELGLPMSKDLKALEAAWEEAADRIGIKLREGKDTAFLSLGDPSVYASCMYVEKRLREQGFQTRMISGVPSFAAAAAACKINLAQGSGQLHLIPAGGDCAAALHLPGTKVFMKAGREWERLRRELSSRPGLRFWYVENCGMQGERIVREAEHLPEQAGYYSLVIVKEETDGEE